MPTGFISHIKKLATTSRLEALKEKTSKGLKVLRESFLLADSSHRQHVKPQQKSRSPRGRQFPSLMMSSVCAVSRTTTHAASSGAGIAGKLSGAGITGKLSGAGITGKLSGAGVTGKLSGAGITGKLSGAGITGKLSGAGITGKLSGAGITGKLSGAGVTGKLSGAGITGKLSGAGVTGKLSGAGITGKLSGAGITGKYNNLQSFPPNHPLCATDSGGLLVLPCTRQCRLSPLTPSPFFSFPGQRNRRKACDRRALQQLALNVHVKYSD